MGVGDQVKRCVIGEKKLLIVILHHFNSSKYPDPPIPSIFDTS